MISVALAHGSISEIGFLVDSELEMGIYHNNQFNDDIEQVNGMEWNELCAETLKREKTMQ